MDGTSAIYFHHRICGMSSDLYGGAEFCDTVPWGFGVTWKFTLDNYKNILEPVYLNTFVESLKLALTSTVVIALIGYPFGYFMARLPEYRKKKAQLMLSTPFWVNS